MASALLALMLLAPHHGYEGMPAGQVRVACAVKGKVPTRSFRWCKRTATPPPLPTVTDLDVQGLAP